MQKDQSLNRLTIKFTQMDILDLSGVTHIIVQGDTTTAYAMAMGFNK